MPDVVASLLTAPGWSYRMSGKQRFVFVAVMMLATVSGWHVRGADSAAVSAAGAR